MIIRILLLIIIASILCIDVRFNENRKPKINFINDDKKQTKLLFERVIYARRYVFTFQVKVILILVFFWFYCFADFTKFNASPFLLTSVSVLSFLLTSFNIVRSNFKNNGKKEEVMQSSAYKGIMGVFLSVALVWVLVSLISLLSMHVYFPIFGYHITKIILSLFFTLLALGILSLFKLLNFAINLLNLF